MGSGSVLIPLTVKRPMCGVEGASGLVCLETGSWRDTSRAKWKPLTFGNLEQETLQGTSDCQESPGATLCSGSLLNGSSLHPQVPL